MYKNVNTVFESRITCKSYEQSVFEKVLMEREFLFGLKEFFSSDSVFLNFRQLHSPEGYWVILEMVVMREVSDSEEDVKEEQYEALTQLSALLNPWLSSKGWTRLYYDPVLSRIEEEEIVGKPIRTTGKTI